MRFAVTWSVAALAQFSRVAAAHGDPQAVDRDAILVDMILRRYPNDVGESRTDRERLWYSDVIGVYYHVDDDKYQVRVMSVGPTRRH